MKPMGHGAALTLAAERGASPMIGKATKESNFF
jgi:hypothetical protein